MGTPQQYCAVFQFSFVKARISAQVCCGVARATLYYRTKGSTTFTSIAMTGSGNTYSATIPASAVTRAGVEYYIQATDLVGNVATFPATNPTTSPQLITVTEKTVTGAGEGLPWFWILLVIVLIAAVGVVAAAMMRRKKP